MKRRNDHSIKIAGLATLGTRKFANRLSSSSSTSLRGSKSISGDVAGGVGSVVVGSSGQKQGKEFIITQLNQFFFVYKCDFAISLKR